VLNTPACAAMLAPSLVSSNSSSSGPSQRPRLAASKHVETADWSFAGIHLANKKDQPAIIRCLVHACTCNCGS
jgi:hypothetical protein